MVEEAEAFVPVAFDEALADECVASGFCVDLSVSDAAVADEGDAVEGDLLVHHRSAGLRRPVRVRMLAGDQITGCFDDPVRVDRGHGPCPQARGLDELGGHDEVGIDLEESGAGEDREACAAGPLIVLVPLRT